MIAPVNLLTGDGAGWSWWVCGPLMILVGLLIAWMVWVLIRDILHDRAHR